MNILLSIVFIVLGFFMVWKEPFFHQFIGRIDWAERKIGGGGTRTLLKLIGIVMIFFGLAGIMGII